MENEKIGDTKMVNDTENTIRKGQLLYWNNLEIDYKTMGVSFKEWNDYMWENFQRIVYDNHIWFYDERYCKENEVVKQIHQLNTDVSEKKLYDDSIGMEYQDSVFNYEYGLFVESGDIVLLTQQQRDIITQNPMSLDILNKPRYIIDDSNGKKIYKDQFNKNWERNSKWLSKNKTPYELDQNKRHRKMVNRWFDGECEWNYDYMNFTEEDFNKTKMENE